MHRQTKFPLLVYIMLVLVLSACGSKTRSIAMPTAPGNGGDGSGTLPTVFIPLAGSIMGWGDGSNIVYVPPGEMNMGEGSEAENAPAHLVTLDGFWIQQTEVTNRRYKRCVAAEGCSVPDEEGDTWYSDPFYADYPVVGVDWYQAQAYCKWISGALPTEAQWEMAAAGPDHNLYPWGSIVPACDLLNFYNCLNPSAPDIVGSYPLGASTFGLLDLAGNVQEWVADKYAPDYYPTSPASNPTGPDAGEMNVVRGGGYDSPELLVRTSTRGALDPTLTALNLGFRCIITGETVAHPTLPVCTMGAYLPTGDQGGEQVGNPTPPSFSSPTIFVISGYCDNSGSYTRTGIVFDVGQPVTNPDEYVVTSGDERLQCTQTPGYPNRLTCDTGGMPPDRNVTITICPPGNQQGDDQSTQEPVCDRGYEIDPTTGLCEYVPVTQTGEGCPSGYSSAASPNCLPEPDPYGRCPDGYMPLVTNDRTVCVPPGGDPGTDCTFGLLATAEQTNCPPDSACLPGYTLDADRQCCQLPQGSHPDCPQNTTFAADVNYCGLARSNGTPGCVTLTVYIPPCLEQTWIPNPYNPGDEPGQPGGPPACSTYPTDDLCKLSGYCTWIPDPLGPPGSGICNP